MSKYVHKNECAGGELITCNVTHNSNEDNLNTKHACFFFFFYLPSGSNDWKTLLACSDGDSGPTRDISCGETDSNKMIGWKEVKQTVGDKGWTVPIRTCSSLSNHMKTYPRRRSEVAMSDSVVRGLRWSGLLIFSITCACVSFILCCTLCCSGSSSLICRLSQTDCLSFQTLDRGISSYTFGLWLMPRCVVFVCWLSLERGALSGKTGIQQDICYRHMPTVQSMPIKWTLCHSLLNKGYCMSHKMPNRSSTWTQDNPTGNRSRISLFSNFCRTPAETALHNGQWQPPPTWHHHKAAEGVQ